MPKAIPFLLPLLLCVGLAAAEPRTWELGDNGQWQNVAAPTTQAAPEPTLDKVEEALRAGQVSAGKDLLLPWFKAHRDSPSRDRAVFLLGESNLLLDNFIEAFYNFDEVLDFYTASPYFQRALQKQYDIADAYLNGKKDAFLGLHFLARTDDAVAMLFRIQQRSPGSPLAEKSLLRTADFYYANGDYDFAFDAYNAYLKSYPRSPNVPEVKLLSAFSSLAQFRGSRYDATPIIDARQQLLDIQAQYPDLARKNNVAGFLANIDVNLAIKFYETGEFYTRTHKPRAAAWCYRYVVDNFPDSESAVRAKEALAAIPEEFKKPLPPLKQVGRPATRPGVIDRAATGAGPASRPATQP